MHKKDADEIANSVDPDQTAPPLGAIWSGSALFAKTCPFENLGKFRYFQPFGSRETYVVGICW